MSATAKNSSGASSTKAGKPVVRFIDLFCGLGGFHLATKAAARGHGVKAECVFASDIDKNCRKVYAGNFQMAPDGDITQIEAKDVADHELLLAGFPCQPFSIIGQRKGFEDTRGTLFFDIARILEAKRPEAFVLENVRMLQGHNGGRTIARIMETLKELGYYAEYRVLNALDFGLPQKRQRVFIVGFRNGGEFVWPEGDVPMKPLSKVLEKEVDRKHYASEHIRQNRLAKHDPTPELTIWHENKSGNVKARPYSSALRAGASYNYLLVNGERRLTPREMLRLQGFPDSYKQVCSDHQTRKQAGNSLPVPVATAVLNSVFETVGWTGRNG